jgi:hypothetical protein
MIKNAIPGVASAFVLSTLIICIYAVLAVDFFRDIFSDCYNPELWGDFLAPDFPAAHFPVTNRGKCFGFDYYGTFFSSLYTLFQVFTGESWSEACVRPVLYYYEKNNFKTLGVSVFFISFGLVNSVVLINVVVAVLIDGISKGNEGDLLQDEADIQREMEQESYEEAIQPEADPTASMKTQAPNEGEQQEEHGDGLGHAAFKMKSSKTWDDLTFHGNHGHEGDWLHTWMHPGAHKKHMQELHEVHQPHRKSILMRTNNLAHKVEDLKTEAANLRTQLDTTTAEMRTQLQEVCSAVRQVLREERHVLQIGAPVSSGEPRPALIGNGSSYAGQSGVT